MINFERVISILKKQYKPIPLEIYKDDPYKILISTLLSSRTRDETTLKACKRLFKIAPKIDKLQQLNNPCAGKAGGTIEQLIFPVGFYKTKASYTPLTQVCRFKLGTS